MKISEDDVLHVADLANLDLTDQERIRMVRDLNSVLQYIDRLNQLDTSAVAPMAQTGDHFLAPSAIAGSERFAYAVRQDIHNGLRPSLARAEALRAAAGSDDRFFKVPKVIER